MYHIYITFETIDQLEFLTKNYPKENLSKHVYILATKKVLEQHTSFYSHSPKSWLI
jgi:hypothetical protein